MEMPNHALQRTALRAGAELGRSASGMSPRTSNFRIYAFGILLVAASTSFASEETNRPTALPSEYTVTPRYEKDVPITQSVAEKLESDIVAIMRTANYNSRAPRPGWSQTDVAELTKGYRKVIESGKYVIITWAQPQRVQTVGGEVTTYETVLALEMPGSRMYNVDNEGRLVHIGKFSGAMKIELDEFVRRLVKDAEPSAPANGASPDR
jgi:hypothetical protein